jgi:hypothetical protein
LEEVALAVAGMGSCPNTPFVAQRFHTRQGHGSNMKKPQGLPPPSAHPKVTAEQAQKYFRDYIRAHADEIDALGRPS